MPPRCLVPVRPSGKQVDAERASDFHSKLSSIFSRSYYPKRELKNMTGRSWQRHVAHRWGSLEGAMKFLMEEFPAIERFVRTYRNSDGARNKPCVTLQVFFFDAEFWSSVCCWCEFN